MATTKKKVTKKTPAKKPAAKKTVRRSKPQVATKQDVKFLQARFTEQTVYWIIIGVAVISLAAWVLSLQEKINEMYDTVDATNSVVMPDKSR